MNLIRFKQWLKESKNNQTLAIFTGRFQGLNRGHQIMIQNLQKQYKRTVVFIVEGKGTSTNKEQNPYTSELRKEMLELAVPGIDVYVIPNGFIPGAIKYLELWKGSEKVVISSGEDRAEGYKAQFKSVPYEVEFIESERIGGYSGTKVREALRNNNFEEYKKNAAKGLDNKEWFEKLKEIINE